MDLSDPYKVIMKSTSDDIVLVNLGDEGTYTVNDVTINGESIDFTKPIENILTFDKLVEHYNTTHDIEATQQYLESYLINNKHDLNLLTKTISSILAAEEKSYDKSKGHGLIGTNQADVLKQFIEADGNQVPNAICTTIHGYMMETLNKCDIPAALYCYTMGTAHAALVYKANDDTYVFNNYYNTTTVQANNIKDAILAATKVDDFIVPNGYISIQDNGKDYKEYFFTDEAAFGKDIDKKNIIHQSLFDNHINSNSSINLSIDNSTARNSTQTLTGFHITDDGNKQKQLEFGLEHKTINKSEILSHSESIGVKAGITTVSTNSETGVKTTKSVSGIYSHMNADQYSIETVGIQGGYAKRLNIYNDNNTNLELGAGFSGIASGTITNNKEPRSLYKHAEVNVRVLHQVGEPEIYNMTPTIMARTINKGTSLNGDARGSLETGLRLNQNIGDNLSLNSDVTAGLIMDIAQVDYNKQIPGVLLGGKLNSQVGLGYENNNFSLASTLNYNMSSTESYNYNNLSALVSGQYKINNNLKLGGEISSQLEKGDLSIGKFNETIDKNLSLEAGLNAQINDRINVRAGCQYNKSLLKEKNKFNFNIGFGYQF